LTYYWYYQCVICLF